MKAAIVIPTFNESENVRRLLEEIFSLNLDLHAVVVDDSSPDHTAEIVEEIKAGNDRVHLVRRTQERSFGGSYIMGFEYALGLDANCIFQMDADLSHSPSFIPDFLKSIRENDLVIGSRYAGGIRVIDWSIGRLLLSLFANRYASLILGLPLADCTSGFRCWNARALRSMPLTRVSSEGYGFLIETAYLAFRSKYSISEIPIVFVERREGCSKMNWKTILESVWLPWKLLLKRLLRLERLGHKEKLRTEDRAEQLRASPR